MFEIHEVMKFPFILLTVYYSYKQNRNQEFPLQVIEMQPAPQFCFFGCLLSRGFHDCRLFLYHILLPISVVYMSNICVLFM
jgi:hypothetical protein